MNAPRYLARALAACAVAALVAACGSSTTTTTTPPSSSTSSPASSSGAAPTITTNWQTFFDAKTPVATRVSLLEDGSQFPSSALKATGLAAGASAKVLSVTNVTASTADVTYNVLLDGVVALKNQKGTAVYQDGTWKVGISSFCGLLTLEAGGKASGLPSVCRTGG